MGLDPELLEYRISEGIGGDPGPTQGTVFLLMCRKGVDMLDSGCPKSSRDMWPNAKVPRDTQANWTDTG